MLIPSILTTLFGCGSGTPAEPAAAPPIAPVAPAPTVAAPTTAPLPPPTPPQGGPLVLIPGQYLEEEIRLGDGEEVQVLCKDQLLSARVTLLPVGEGRVFPSNEVCPKFTVMFRGLSDRMGSGSIKPGIGRGPFGAGKPRDYEAAYSRGVFTIDTHPDGTQEVYMDADDADPVLLFKDETGTGAAGLTWIGDLDDDNVPDFVINTPASYTEARMRLFLSAKSANHQPELVTLTPFTLW